MRIDSSLEFNDGVVKQSSLPFREFFILDSAFFTFIGGSNES